MMDVFITVVFKSAIRGFTKSRVFCFFWFFSFPRNALISRFLQFGQNLQLMLFMGEAWTCLWPKSHSYFKERSVSILLMCDVTGLTRCGN